MTIGLRERALSSQLCEDLRLTYLSLIYFLVKKKEKVAVDAKVEEVAKRGLAKPYKLIS